MLLNFIAYDFSNHAKASLGTLAEKHRLAAYVDEFKSIVVQNGGHIIAKCAFQMFSKSRALAVKLDGIARQLRASMAACRAEMTAGMTG